MPRTAHNHRVTISPVVAASRLLAEAGIDAHADTAIGLAIATLRALCGPAWLPTEVRVVRPRPYHPEAWKRLLHAPVLFGAESNLIVFQSRWLDQRVERADPELRRTLLDKRADLEARGGASDTERIGAVVRSCLLAGDASLPHGEERRLTRARDLPLRNRERRP